MEEVIQQTPKAFRHMERAIRKIPKALCHPEEVIQQTPKAFRHMERAIRKIPKALCHPEEVIQQTRLKVER